MSHSDAADVCRTLAEVKTTLSSCLDDSDKAHYVVCIPDDSITVHSDFREVQKMMKDHKNHNPRMYRFRSFAEAEAFAKKHTANEVCEGTTFKSNYPQEKAEVELSEQKLFPSLTTPQLNEFRIFLEKGKISAARELLMTNPRYLVTSIDIPTVLKEGPRYNALHASVMAGKLESCKLVMEMISDVEYLRCLYETQKRAEENSKRLIDLYLNTPDKVANKTPLHISSEKGYVDIVAFLVSFKACIRNYNHHIHESVKKGDEQYENIVVTGETPEEIACSRYKGPNAAALKAKIVDLIQAGTCYVPLIRSDTTGPYAKIGDPYIASSPYKLVSEIENAFKSAPAASIDPEIKDFRSMKVWAFAGPLSPQEAENFKKEWKSPRLKRPNQNVWENHKIMDGDKGFERFGRELADSHSTSWQEYWPFLETFADLRSEDGLDKLEMFFQKQQVLNLMQALSKNIDFISAPPYDINWEYILKQEKSDTEESDEDVELYFSAESPSGSDEDVFEGAENLSDKKVKNSSSLPATNHLGYMFSYLWRSVGKLKNLMSPIFGKRKHSTSSEAETAKVGIVSDSPEVSDSSGKDKKRRKYFKLESKTGATPVKSTERLSHFPNEPSKISSQNKDSSSNTSQMQLEIDAQLNTKDSFQTCAIESVPKLENNTHSDQTGKQILSGVSENAAENMSNEFATSGAGLVAENKTDVGSLQVDPVASQLTDSFNNKLDSECLSPSFSPSTISSTPSSLLSRLNIDFEPSIYIFTGKLFSRVLTELKSRNYTNDRNAEFEDQSQLPTFFLRQAENSNAVLADCFLPGIQDTKATLLKVSSQNLCAMDQNEAIKHVWVNFLTVFSTSADAKRFATLSSDETVCVQLVGVPQDGDIFVSSSIKEDSVTMKELFIKCRDNLLESKHSIRMLVRIVRSSTLPCQDVFVCGTTLTKADGDVYHTLNSRAQQLISSQPGRFAQVSRWYDQMRKQGKDIINSLPSPSRVLRSGKWNLSLGGPRIDTHPETKKMKPGISSLNRDETKLEDQVIRKLFPDSVNDP